MIVGRGVEKVEGRCGGQAVLEGTRLTIKCLDAMWHSGGDELVAREYPYLTREQRMAAYGYAEEHRVEFKEDELAYGIDAEDFEFSRKNLKDNLARYRVEVARLEALLSEEEHRVAFNEDVVILDAEPIGGALEDVARAGKALPITPNPRAPGTPHPWQETDAEIREELAKAPDATPDLVKRLSRLQVEHDAMATAGRQAHDECVTAQRRAARAIAALRFLQSGLVSLPDKVQSAVSRALSDEPPPPRVSVRDIGVGGPYRLFVGDHGIATWPSKPALEEPKEYAEEVARCLRLALGVTDVRPRVASENATARAPRSDRR